MKKHEVNNLVKLPLTDNLHNFSEKNRESGLGEDNLWKNMRSIISWNCPFKIYMYIFASLYTYLEDNTDKWNCQSFYLELVTGHPLTVSGPKEKFNFPSLDPSSQYFSKVKFEIKATNICLKVCRQFDEFELDTLACSESHFPGKSFCFCSLWRTTLC
jgi:hypothetical protein